MSCDSLVCTGLNEQALRSSDGTCRCQAVTGVTIGDQPISQWVIWTLVTVAVITLIIVVFICIWGWYRYKRFQRENCANCRCETLYDHRRCDSCTDPPDFAALEYEARLPWHVQMRHLCCPASASSMTPNRVADAEMTRTRRRRRRPFPRDVDDDADDDVDDPERSPQRRPEARTEDLIRDAAAREMNGAALGGRGANGDVRRSRRGVDERNGDVRRIPGHRGGRRRGAGNDDNDDEVETIADIDDDDIWDDESPSISRRIDGEETTVIIESTQQHSIKQQQKQQQLQQINQQRHQARRDSDVGQDSSHEVFQAPGRPSKACKGPGRAHEAFQDPTASAGRFYHRPMRRYQRQLAEIALSQQAVTPLPQQLKHPATKDQLEAAELQRETVVGLVAWKMQRSRAILDFLDNISLTDSEATGAPPTPRRVARPASQESSVYERPMATESNYLRNFHHRERKRNRVGVAAENDVAAQFEELPIGHVPVDPGSLAQASPDRRLDAFLREKDSWNLFKAQWEGAQQQQEKRRWQASQQPPQQRRKQLMAR